MTLDHESTADPLITLFVERIRERFIEVVALGDEMVAAERACTEARARFHEANARLPDLIISLAHLTGTAVPERMDGRPALQRLFGMLIDVPSDDVERAVQLGVFR